jgi:hypothetical protein
MNGLTEMFDTAHKLVADEARRRGMPVEMDSARVRTINGKRTAVCVVLVNAAVATSEGDLGDAEIVVATDMNGRFWITTRAEWDAERVIGEVTRRA